MINKLPVLTKNKEFQRVYNKGKYSASALLVVYVLPNRFNVTRIGITTSKKVGNAVKRNRIRRLIKENLRILSDRVISGIDLVVVARKAEEDLSLDIIGKELRYLLNKQDVLDREKL